MKALFSVIRTDLVFAYTGVIDEVNFAGEGLGVESLRTVATDVGIASATIFAVWCPSSG